MDREAGPQRDRVAMVIGRSSERTRAVVRALTGVPGLVWPVAPELALTTIDTSRVACVILSDDMDQESAADILVRLREARPVLPVFVVTDTNDVADAVQAMRLGATAAVEVPPSTGLLREYVTQALK